MDSYKFAAAIYRVSGRVEYVNQAIRTYRGCVSHDKGETIMHMAIQNGDVATIRMILDKLPLAALAFNKDDIRAISYVVNLINTYAGATYSHPAIRAAMRVACDILYRIIRSIVSTNMPRRCYAIEICVRCAATTSRTATSAIITQALVDYAPEYRLPAQPTADERDLGLALSVYANPELIRDVKLYKVLAMITPDITDDHGVTSARNAAKGYRYVSDAAREAAASLSNAVSDDDINKSRHSQQNVYGSKPTMRAWNYAHEHRWNELAGILESNAEIPRNHRGSSIIVIILCQSCGSTESMRILRAILHRWPLLTIKELAMWIQCRNAEEINLLLEVAPHQPHIADVFEWAEHGLCTSICHLHWENTLSPYAQLDALHRLYLIHIKK